jgi:hypothetical protein
MTVKAIPMTLGDDIHNHGGPSAEKTAVIGVRLLSHQIRGVDAWIARQAMPMTRPEAIRGMIEAMLQILTNSRSQSVGEKRERQRTRASEMAGHVIDQVIDTRLDTPASAEDKQTRKRRLIKGPSEFRDTRADRGKPKR